MRTACSLCTLHARMSHDPWRRDVHSCTPSSTSRHTSSRGTCVPCRGDAGLRGVYRASTLSQTRAESLSTRHFAVETSCFMLDSRSRPHRDVGGVTVDARSDPVQEIGFLRERGRWDVFEARATGSWCGCGTRASADRRSCLQKCTRIARISSPPYSHTDDECKRTVPAVSNRGPPRTALSLRASP
jgi:hypothetical protein